MIHATPLIVLHVTPTGEKSLVVHALSARFGRRSFLTSATRSRGLFQPLAILDAEVVENPRSDLWRLRSVGAAQPLTSLRTNLYKNTIALFLSEVLFRLLREGDSSEGLYAWCERSIVTLDALEGDFSNFHLRFLLELAAQLGFTPSWGDLAPFAEEHLNALEQLRTASFPDAMLLPLSGSSRSEMAGALLKYLSVHSEMSLNVRSLDILSQVFA